MARSRASARAAGSSFETLIAKGLAEYLEDDRIERRVKSGAKDRGDITGVRIKGLRVVIEAKNCAKMNLSGWVNEAEVERGNDDAGIGMVIHKRIRHSQLLDQYCTLTVRDLITIVTGERPE